MDIPTTMLAAQAAAPEASPPPLNEALGIVSEAIESNFDLGFFNTLVFAAVVAAITFIIIKILQRFVKKKFTGNSRIFYRLLYVAIILVAVIIVLMTIEPMRNFGTALLASSSVAAVVIGLAAQSTLGNLFSGISISMAKPFEVGEFIEILNISPPVSGVVEEIGLRHTTIRDPENKRIVVPNNVLDQEMLRATRYLQGSHVCNFLYVNIAYHSDIDKAIELLSRLAEGHENSLDVRTEEQRAEGAPKVRVFVTDLGDVGVKLRVGVWTQDTATGFATLSDLRYRVKKGFAAAGIEIPYPYQNVVLHHDGEA